MERVALARLDSLREVDLLFVRQDPPSRESLAQVPEGRWDAGAASFAAWLYPRKVLSSSGS